MNAVLSLSVSPLYLQRLCIPAPLYFQRLCIFGLYGAIQMLLLSLLLTKSNLEQHSSSCQSAGAGNSPESLFGLADDSQCRTEEIRLSFEQEQHCLPTDWPSVQLYITLHYIRTI